MLETKGFSSADHQQMVIFNSALIAIDSMFILYVYSSEVFYKYYKPYFLSKSRAMTNWFIQK